MKQIKFSAIMILMLILSIAFSACGGGGSGDDGDGNDDDKKLTFSNFQKASAVIGQPDFISNGYTSADKYSINYIFGNPAVYDGCLYLPDYDNNRIMGYNKIPESNGAGADFVLGASDFTATSGGCTGTLLMGTQGLSVDDGKLFVTDYKNNRILIYNSVPLTGPGKADVAAGQSDLFSNTPGTTSSTLSGPEASFAGGGKLVVSDSDNNRILIWSTIPAVSGTPADFVLGQSDFTHNARNDDDDTGTQDGFSNSAPTARTLSYPTGIWTDGQKIIASDSENCRVLIWNTFPSANFTPADVVLGQSDFTHKASNDDDQDGVSDAPTARTLDYPYDGLYCKDGQLFVCDFSNNRILIWNTFPTMNFTPADVVLGQSDFKHNAYNDDDQDGVSSYEPTARTLDCPSGILVTGKKLIVAERYNYRYLIYESE